MECKFHVGQKVVCVDDSTSWPTKQVFKGQVYTIAEVGVGITTDGFGEVAEVVYVRVEEALFNVHTGAKFCSHPADFRPLETQTNIDSLRAHLNVPAKQGEDA